MTLTSLGFYTFTKDFMGGNVKKMMIKNKIIHTRTFNLVFKII